MRILLASSEVIPFAKTGGLADVCGTLPIELRNLGHEVVVFLPAYRCIWNSGQQIDLTEKRFQITLGKKTVDGCLLRSTLPGSDVPVFFVHQPNYFDRTGLYNHNGEDYGDNSERFIFFCRAVMESIGLLNWTPDLIHCNDWQTGLIPALLRAEYAMRPGLERMRSLLTIHNLAYQGVYWQWDMLLTGLDWKYFNWQQMEFYGQLNLLKSGIVFADAISTVSRRYAQEIQTHEFGHGLDGVLRARSHDLFGILNGIDVRNWDPASDPNLTANYDLGNWRSGKAKCKSALQAECNLPVQPSVPLIGCIGRLATQKGWSLIIPALERLLVTSDVQWVVLGTGEWEYQQTLQRLQQQHPNRLAVRLEFAEQTAHRIEAGADIFLMPSRYEPCGLNQMYSLRYGTPPVVFYTGGLADTITDATEDRIQSGEANGFVFYDYQTEAMIDALRRAVAMHQDHPELWDRLISRGMSQDFSWSQSAKQYQEMYQQICSKH